VRTGISQSVVVGLTHKVIKVVGVRRRNLLLLQVGVKHRFNTTAYNLTNEQGSRGLRLDHIELAAYASSWKLAAA